MLVEQVGVVIAVQGGIAKVKASRHNDCENCGACPGNSAMIVEVQNTIAAQPGQQIVFVIEQVNMLWAAFVVYILPIVATIVGVFLAQYFAPIFNIDNNTGQIIAGLGAFALAVMFVRRYDRYVRRRTQMLPYIIRKL